MIGTTTVSSDIFIFGIMGFFAGLYLFFKGFSWQKQKQLIENTPMSKVRSIAMGPVEVFGSVTPSHKSVLKSPLTGRDCVYYRYAVEEYRKTGKSSSWVTIKRGTDGKHFFLNDDTGSVLVDPKDADVSIPADFYYEDGFGRKIPDNVQRFFDNNNIRYGGIFNARKRVTEYYIAPSDKVYVFGTAGDNPFVEPGAAKNSSENVVIQKGTNEKFYYISDKPEKSVLADFTIKVLGGILGGAILIVAGLGVILIYLGIL